MMEYRIERTKNVTNIIYTSHVARVLLVTTFLWVYFLLVCLPTVVYDSKSEWSGGRIYSVLLRRSILYVAFKGKYMSVIRVVDICTWNISENCLNVKSFKNDRFRFPLCSRSCKSYNMRCNFERISLRVLRVL